MKSKKNKEKTNKGLKQKNGFAIIMLDFIFVAIGILVLIIGLTQSSNVLASIANAIINIFTK